MSRTRKHLTPAEAEAKGLLCRKHLKERFRLMPGLNTKPAGSVWQGQGLIMCTTHLSACRGAGCLGVPKSVASTSQRRQGSLQKTENKAR